MKYELINPSDRIYFDAASDVIAFVSCLLIGNGYGAKRTDDDKTAVGFYPFGITDEQLEKEIGESGESFLKTKYNELGDCLLSFHYSSNRTSMNRIVDRAHKIGESLKKGPK